MDGATGLLLFTLIAVGLLVPGIILLSRWKVTRILGLLIPGWCLVGTFGILATLLFLYFLVISSTGLIFFLIALSPLIIIGGLIATLTIGINNLMVGFVKGNINASKITIGFVLLGINFTILASIIILIVLFMNGFIPIALM